MACDGLWLSKERYHGLNEIVWSSGCFISEIGGILLFLPNLWVVKSYEWAECITERLRIGSSLEARKWSLAEKELDTRATVAPLGLAVYVLREGWPDFPFGTITTFCWEIYGKSGNPRLWISDHVALSFNNWADRGCLVRMGFIFRGLEEWKQIGLLSW